MKYIENNPTEYYFLLSDEDIGVTEDTDKQIKNKLRKQFIINYAKNASK